MKNIKLQNCIFAACLILPAVISACTTLYGDDLIYGTYFCGGIKNFFRLTADHYMRLNGRIFVHFALELLLIFRDRLLFIAIPAMIYAVFFVMSKLLHISKKQKTVFYSYGLMGIMCLSPYILREGMLWMAGAFNYIFPVSFALAAFYSVIKAYKKPLHPLIYPFVFLCGATTEQCAVIAISSSILYIIYEYVSEKKIKKEAVFLVIAMLLGLMTVMLAPGTVIRVGKESPEQASDLLTRFETLYQMPMSDIGILWVYLFFELIFGIALFKTNKPSAYAGFAGILAESILAYTGYFLAGGIILTLILLLYAAALFKKMPIYAILLLSALTSLGMLFLSSTFGLRNYMPSILILLGLCAGLLSEHIKNKAALPISFLSACICFSPTLLGYAQNRKIINKNIHSLRHDEVIRYDVDINPKYGYYQFYADSFYLDGIKIIYGLDKSAEIHITGKDFKDLYINGNLTENPVYLKDGISYYPMRNVITAYGGTVDYDSEKNVTLININGKTIIFDAASKLFIKDDVPINADNYRLYDTKYGNMFNSNVYLTKEAFRDIFEIQLQS